jgi:hypothetical protein
MITIKEFRKLALSFTETVELPHFEKTSFRVRKKIFVTLSEPEKKICLKLPVAGQDLFSRLDDTVIYPVPNKWGKQGWTFIHLDKVRKSMLKDAMILAYNGVAPKKFKQE